jgi:polyhydroxyalkanoate synthesis regulator phasin
MKTKKTIIILVLGALAVTAAFGAIAYQSVLAATPTATTTGTTSTTSQVGPGWEGGKGMHGGYTNQQLADALGITVDALNTAYQNAYSAALKDAVSKGLITQAQADQLTTNGTAFPYGDRWNNWLTQNGIDFNTYLADALGISVDTLKAAYKTAYNTNIDQMVTAGNLTQTQADLMKGKYALFNDSTFQSSMQSAFTSAVNAAVSSGVITQAQAEQILSNSSNMFMPGMDGFGGPGGPHGHGGGGFVPDNNNIPSTTP